VIAGLAKDFERYLSDIPLIIWIIYNSGSMSCGGGYTMASIGGSMKCFPCSRWTELKECVIYHAELAAFFEAPTIFRLLNSINDIDGMNVAVDKGGKRYEEAKYVKHKMNGLYSSGFTPLTKHLKYIKVRVKHILPNLSKKFSMFL